MTKLHIGDLALPLDDFVVARTAILGITRSGKTYAAKGLAEQLLDRAIPIVVFDAIGIWRFLRTPGDGPRAKGYRLVVAGGAEPDLPLTPESAPTIVRAAIRENIPLIIDLYDPKLSKKQWRLIVQTCFRTLLYENKGVRHIFLEESAEYAPQKIYDGETYAEVEKLARMGGNVGLGITFINQRAQELNKAVLELCDNLVLLRQRGSHAIDALEKWLDRVSPTTASAVAKALPHMTQGDCWVWAEASEQPIRTHTRPLRSFHPDRRKGGEIAAAAAAAVDTKDFVERMHGELTVLIERAKADDPKELRRRIGTLEAELRQARAVKREAEHVEVSILTEDDRLVIGEARGLAVAATETVDRLRTEFAIELGAWRNAVAGVTAKLEALGVKAAARPVAAPAPVRPAVARPALPRAPERNGDGPALAKCERAILAVLAQYADEGCTAGRLTLLSGYRYSGGFKNSLATLRTGGYLTGGNTEVMRITEAGLAFIGGAPAPLTGQTLRDYWLTHSSFGKCERAILATLLTSTDGASAESLCRATNYEYSGGFKNALANLRTAGVLVGKNTETMRVCDELRDA